MSSFPFSFEIKHSFAHKYCPTDEFICVGHFKEEYLKQCIEEGKPARRENENMIPDYVLFENDEISLEEQLKIINALDHSCIRSITYSGGKSYHVLFRINAPEDITNEEYKKVWEDIMKYYNLYDIADKNNTNIGRLTRNPNGFRRKYIENEKHEIIRIENTRIRQTCIYDNPNCDSIDISSDLEQIRYENAQEQVWREEKRKIYEKERANSDRKTPHPEEVLLRNKNTNKPAYEGYQMWQAGDFPKGYQYLSPARGMFTYCILQGCDENETLEFCRDFLRAAKAAHPSNVRLDPNRWDPRKKF